MDVVRVFIIDDHRVLRDALIARLWQDTQVCAVGGAGVRDSDLDARIRAARPDVITVEVAQLRPDPAEHITRLRQAHPKAEIVALTESSETRHAVACARAGAVAWVSKDSSVEDLIAALREAYAGRATYPPAHLGEVLRELRADVQRARERTEPLDVLSEREREVLQCMVAGLRRAEIAATLGVSANTIRTHTHNILGKLGVSNSLEAVRAALTSGMRPAHHEADSAGDIIASGWAFGTDRPVRAVPSTEAVRSIDTARWRDS